MSRDDLGARWDEAYVSGRAPWDIGRPQPAFRRLADAGELRELILDAGCGTGEHTLMLAERGFEAVGLDISEAAIERARAKARIRGLDATFVVGDALALEQLGRRFGSVIDSGMFHTLDDEARAGYVRSLARVLVPGGRVHLLCFSELTPGGDGPRRVTQAEIRTAFADGWTVESIEVEMFEVRPEFGDEPPHAWLATVARAEAGVEGVTLEPASAAPVAEEPVAEAPEDVEPVAEAATPVATIAVVGSPTALGGHFAGMDQGPAALRGHGLLDRLRAMPGLAAATLVNFGDAPIERGWGPDDDPRMKNRQRIIDYLPALASHVAGALRGGGDGAARLLVLGGDCTSHAGAMAGLRRASPEARFAIAWFDAHGDFNTPETTPSGNVWGMPFAMLCGRGDPGLVAACEGPTVREDDAALLGGQVLDEQESRMLAASPVSHFGAGMLAGEAGLAALEAWARVVGARTDGMYVAFDLDAIDATEGVSVAMPERGGLAVETAVAALRILSSTNRVVGFGPTATMPRADVDFERHVDIVARLTQATLAPG